MPVRPEIKVEGARELQKALRAVEDGTTEIKDVHADAAALVEQRAHQLVPRLSGRLDASVRSSGQARQGVVRAGGASIPWAGPIHFGWPAHNIEPQPFLYDAVDQRRDEVIGLYQERVDKLIRDNGLKGGVG